MFFYHVVDIEVNELLDCFFHLKSLKSPVPVTVVAHLHSGWPLSRYLVATLVDSADLEGYWVTPEMYQFSLLFYWVQK